MMLSVAVVLFTLSLYASWVQVRVLLKEIIQQGFVLLIEVIWVNHSLFEVIAHYQVF